MTLLYLLKPDMKIGPGIDTYESLTWRRPFWPVGRDADLTCVIAAEQATRLQLRRGSWLVVREDYQWGATVLPVYRIDKIDWDTQGPGTAAISARTAAKPIGERRIVSIASSKLVFGSSAHDSQVDEPAETAIKHYWTDWVGPGANSIRIWPELTIEPDQGRGDDVIVHARGHSVTEASELAGVPTGVGWEVVYRIVEEGLWFRTIHGQPRPNVVLSVDGGTASRIQLQEDELAPNLAYVLGKGEGVDRPAAAAWYGTQPQQANRREIVIEATDLETVPDLIARGIATLREANSQDERVTVDLLPFGLLRYRDHFAIGDEIGVRHDPWGWSTTRRVVDVAVTHSAEGVVPVAEIGEPWPGHSEPRDYE